MSVTASKLRQNIYQLLDEVLQTGVPLEVDCKGRKLVITPVQPQDKLKNLKKRACINGNPEDLVHMDWSGDWRP